MTSDRDLVVVELQGRLGNQLFQYASGLGLSRRLGAALRFRFSAPHHDKQTSTAGLCEEWCSRWLGLCAGKPSERSQTSWELGEYGRASIVRGDGAHRRDVHELHVPTSWL